MRLRAAAAAVILLIGMGGVSTALAAPASAASSSTLTSQYWWPHNGCTNVSDSPAGVSFTYACNHHDGCYALRWSSSRATCDWWFYNDMRNACAAAPWWKQGVCLDAATAYYLGVRAFGQKYWDSNGLLVRINTNMA